jgi:microcystin-dependent protein
VSNLTTVGATTGAKQQTIAQANLPAVNFTHSGTTINEPAHGHRVLGVTNTDANALGLSNGATNGLGGSGAAGSIPYILNSPAIGSPFVEQTTIGITISAQGVAASGGSGTPLPTIQPSLAVFYVIKL